MTSSGLPARRLPETVHAGNGRGVYSSRSVDERERRIGANEAYWRQVNELAPPEPGILNVMFCECGRLECRERVPMTLEEYEAVRSRSTTFLVAPGHAILDVETVVDHNERFEVVEKQGEAARAAVETDTR
jgi:hypothetical protein